MNPKDFILGLAMLDFTFLDFFIDPNIENQESYLEDLLERVIEGLKSEDPVFHKATNHFIERIIYYLFRSKKKQRERTGLENHRSNLISITWLLEKIFEKGGQKLLVNAFNELKGAIGNVDQKHLSRLELIEDIATFKSFLKSLIKDICLHDPFKEYAIS